MICYIIKGINPVLSAPPAGGSEKQMNLLFARSLDNKSYYEISQNNNRYFMNDLMVSLKDFIYTANSYQTIIVVLVAGFFSFLWLFFCWLIEDKNKEPKKQLVRLFFWGAFIVIPVALITVPLNYLLFGGRDPVTFPIWLIFINAILFYGLIEEYAKYAVLSDKIYYHLDFNRPRDGMIYGMVIGLGFAFVENILYSVALSANLWENLNLLTIRSFASASTHFLAGGIIGYFMGQAKFLGGNKKGSNRLILKGLFLAIIFHGFYNSLLLIIGKNNGNVWLIVVWALYIIGVYYFIFKNLRKIQKLDQYKLRLPKI